LECLPEAKHRWPFEQANDEPLGYLIRNILREQSRARSTMPQGKHHGASMMTALIAWNG
jgi:hypothetical protein